MIVSMGQLVRISATGQIGRITDIDPLPPSNQPGHRMVEFQLEREIRAGVKEWTNCYWKTNEQELEPWEVEDVGAKRIRLEPIDVGDYYSMRPVPLPAIARYVCGNAHEHVIGGLTVYSQREELPVAFNCPVCGHSASMFRAWRVVGERHTAEDMHKFREMMAVVLAKGETG